MKFKIKINKVTTVEEIESYWTPEDYIYLLEKMEYPDAKDAKKENLRELLMMAITDFEPNDAAAIILEYKLSDHLNEGQINQVSNDMLLDKIAEEYPVIGIQSTLFHINQLLYKAYNGKFPNTKANIIALTIQPTMGAGEDALTKEEVLKLMANGLSDRNLIKRLFGGKMKGNEPFEEADDIIWELVIKDNDNIEVLTSCYWISQEDLTADEFEAELPEEDKEEG